MDVYGEVLVDDLLYLPSVDFFSTSSSDAVVAAFHRPSSAANSHFDESSIPSHLADLSDILHVPNDDAVELEWMSNCMDDSFTDFPANELTASAVNFHSINVSRARSKRSRAAVSGGENEEVVRRCTHCASEKTPQWRTGPLGPKTMCNACGVRYKSGRLVPEYRPAASPTFRLTQHSNSHRKVLELRRQKEMQRQQQMQQQQEGYGRHFRVC